MNSKFGSLTRRRPEFGPGVAGAEAAKLKKFSDAGGSQIQWLSDAVKTQVLSSFVYIHRKAERAINLPDILFVLEFGRREQAKDAFDIQRQNWKYAIRGNTTKGTALRVVVAFESAMVIITVMKVGGKS